MSRSGKLLLQLGILLVVGFTAGFLALVLAGTIGGVAMGVAPAFTFRQVEGLVCPEGTRLEYSAIRRSFHAPGESEPRVECVSEDGAAEDALLRAILAVLGTLFVGIFLLVFFGLLLPIELILVVIARRRARDQPRPFAAG